MLSRLRIDERGAGSGGRIEGCCLQRWFRLPGLCPLLDPGWRRWRRLLVRFVLLLSLGATGWGRRMSGVRLYGLWLGF